MLPQLKLNDLQLARIGLAKRIFMADKFYPEDEPKEKTVWEIPCLNGKFYYNPDEGIYKWYQTIIVGNGANDIHLDITDIEELFVLLTVFRVDFRFIKN